jgi:hypothetical protein
MGRGPAVVVPGPERELRAQSPSHLDDEGHEAMRLERLPFQESFEVRRAVYGGRAVWDPKLASAAVGLARRLEELPRRWSRDWFRSFLLDPFDVPPYVVFSLFLLAVWPSLITLGILAAGLLLIALTTRRRRRRKARQAEAANLRLLHGGTPEVRRGRFYGRDGFLRGAPPYPWWQWVLVAIVCGAAMFAYFAVITGFHALELQAILWAIAGLATALATRRLIIRWERSKGRGPKS